MRNVNTLGPARTAVVGSKGASPTARTSSCAPPSSPPPPSARSSAPLQDRVSCFKSRCFFLCYQQSAFTSVIVCNFAGGEAVVLGKGRHDPCVLPRAVPVVEAMVALVLVDALMQHTAQCHLLDSRFTCDVPHFNALGKQFSPKTV